MSCRYSMEVKGNTDFSGYWRVAKLENFDVFLQDLGLPWVVRKAAVKFAANTIDVISHAGTVMKVTSLNAKGSWSRAYDTEREITQRNAEGVLCKTTAWWEGKVLRTRLEGSPLGPCESWRYMRNDIMVVKTSVKLASGVETSMFWYFEKMEVLHRHLGGQGRYHLLRRIERDQRQVEKATREDNRYLQRVLLDWDRWNSPADEFIQVVSPSYSRTRLRLLSSHAGSPHVSQGNLSKSPSASSLGSPLDIRSVEGRSGRSEVGSRSRLGSESTSALDKASIADLARADKMVANAAAAAAAQQRGVPGPASHPSSVCGLSGPSSPTAAAAPPPQPPRASADREFYREISLSLRPEDAAAAGSRSDSPPRAANGELADGGEGVTFRPGEAAAVAAEPLGGSAAGLRFGAPVNGAGAARVTGSSASPGAGVGPSGPSVTSEAAAAPSDMATVGSGSGVDTAEAHPLSQHVRVASAGSLSTAVAGGRAPPHRKNLSGEAIGSDGRGSVRPTPRSTPTHRQMPTSAEQLLAFKAHEYLDSRGITAVVPVATPNDTSEPQLLCMSPEQAEQTHAKLRELEEEMLLQRQEYRKGVTCCGWFVVSWVSSSLPDHLRVWEMSVS